MAVNVDEMKSELEAKSTTQATPAAPAYADQSRIDEINRMYDAQVNSQKNSIETAYQKNMGDLESNRDQIAQQYQKQRNATAAEYERQRRNFNQQAASVGLNTGAGAQATLAQNAAYQKGQASINVAEANANTSLNKSIADLKIQYQSDINDAVAKNDYNRAAALLDEYNNAYSKAASKAQTMAQFGDFSGYADIYGADQANQMSEVWALQNPVIAYALGRITAEKYYQITGHYPPDYKVQNNASYGSGPAQTVAADSEWQRLGFESEDEYLEYLWQIANGDSANANGGNNASTVKASQNSGNLIHQAMTSRERQSTVDPVQNKNAQTTASLANMKTTGGTAFRAVENAQKKLLQDPEYRNFMGLI